MVICVISKSTCFSLNNDFQQVVEWVGLILSRWGRFIRTSEGTQGAWIFVLSTNPPLDVSFSLIFFTPFSVVACMHAQSVVSDSVTPWIVACQAPLSMGFLRQEYWSGLPFPSPGYLPDPGMEPESPALAGEFFTTEPPGKPLFPSSKSVPRPCLCPWPPLLPSSLPALNWAMGAGPAERKQTVLSFRGLRGPGVCFQRLKGSVQVGHCECWAVWWSHRLLTEGSCTVGVESVIFHIQPKYKFCVWLNTLNRLLSTESFLSWCLMEKPDMFGPSCSSHPPLRPKGQRKGSAGFRLGHSAAWVLVSSKALLCPLSPALTSR